MAELRDGSGRLIGFACARGRAPTPRCTWCRAPGHLLCDYVLPTGRTCDARMCALHASTVGPNRDHCPTHAGGERDG